MAESVGRLVGRGEITVSELRDRAEALLARIEEQEAVPDWCWPILTETLGQLMELPDELAWVPVAYLSCVLVRGDAMFDPAATQARLDVGPSRAPTVQCRCGTDVEQTVPRRRRGREVMVAVCPSCSHTLAMFGGEPYDRPTLIGG